VLSVGQDLRRPKGFAILSVLNWDLQSHKKENNKRSKHRKIRKISSIKSKKDNYSVVTDLQRVQPCMTINKSSNK